LLVVLLCIVFTSKAVSQEQKNPRAFADFLFSSELYDLAADEYERLLYYNASDIGLLKRLIKCYTYTGQDFLLDSRYDFFQAEDKVVASSYYDLLLSIGNTEKLESLFSKQQDLFTLDEQNKIRFKIAIGQYDWSQAKDIYELNKTEAYLPIVNRIEQSKFKSPGTAAVLSTLVPGLGRIYAKDAKDGIISLVFVGSFAYQSYRRFHQQGTKSVGAWIYGGLALGFHVSNIYGSYQSAKYYNKKQNEKIYSFAMPHLLKSS